MNEIEEMLEKVQKEKKFINNELYDIFSHMQMNGTYAGRIIDGVNWAFDNLKVALDKLKEQEK